MAQLQTMLQNTLKRIKTNSSTKQSKGYYECEICKDSEWMLDPDTNTAKPCKCREARVYRRMLEGSGISKAFLQKTFDNFKPTHKDTANAKKMAMDYVRRFDEIRETNENSIAFLGQVGSGKTHLSIAIANESGNWG